MGAGIQPQPFGKYYLLEKIATGGMAEIYKAMYKTGGDFEKTLVIKRILPHLANDDEFVNMFRDEAKLTVRLNHANIVQVFDFGRLGDDHFLAMEYVQGQNLRQVIRRCQELGATVPIPFALYCCAEVCKGLQYAHSRKDENDRSMGIIHRDVTPSNILVSYEGEVKIADFGIAKATARHSGTQAGMIKGKASYLSPEAVRGKDVLDHRADVFSLGAVLWELLVGKKLFSGENDFQIMNRILEEPIRPPSQVNASVPEKFDLVVMMALERDRNRRYPNAASLQKDLTRLLAEFGGNVTTVDIANFLHRLFRKEMEAEKEASKSLRRMVIDEAKVDSAAREGATLTAPEPEGPERTALPAQPRQLSMGVLVAGGVGVMGVIGLAIGTLIYGRGPGPAPATPVPSPTTAVVVLETPVPLESPAATLEAAATPETVATADAIPEPTPEPRPERSARPERTPRGSDTRTAVATPRATRAPRAFGTLALDSQPWGEIYVDGKKIGRQTPALNLRLPVGKRRIRLVNTVQNVEARFEVEIVEDRVVKKVVKLERR